MKFIKVTKTNNDIVYINAYHITEIITNNYDEVYIYTKDMRIAVRESIEEVLALLGENVKQG